MKLLLPLLLLGACSHFHRPSERSEAQVQDRELSVHYDWNQDGADDRAELGPGDEEGFLEFSITLSAVGGAKKVVSNDLFIEADAVPGAYLKLLPNGDIQIIQDQTGIGAAAAITVYTVTYFTERFLLREYDYSFEDRVEHAKRGDCQANLLEGEGKRDGWPFRLEPQEIDINKIDINFQPKPCKLRFRR